MLPVTANSIYDNIVINNNNNNDNNDNNDNNENNKNNNNNNNIAKTIATRISETTITPLVDSSKL